MKRKVNCMFLLPPELTGRDHDVCRLFGECVFRMGMMSCAARTRHTKVSRQALAEAIEIVRAGREKDSPLTPPAVL